MDHPFSGGLGGPETRGLTPVPQLHATIEARRGRPDLQAVLNAIVAELTEHGITPTPMSVISTATDHGADEALTAALAAILNGKDQTHATRSSAGGRKRDH